MAKIKTSLSKAAVKGETSESSDQGSDKDGAIRKMEKKIKAAKKKSAEMAEKLKLATGQEKKSKKRKRDDDDFAQVAASPMTESEILALSQTTSNSKLESEAESDSEAESSSGNSSSAASSSGSESGSESDAETESESRAQIGMEEEDILQLAQVHETQVKMVPQVHVQVTRIGHDGKAIK